MLRGLKDLDLKGSPLKQSLGVSSKRFSNHACRKAAKQTTKTVTPPDTWIVWSWRSAFIGVVNLLLDPEGPGRGTHVETSRHHFLHQAIGKTKNTKNEHPFESDFETTQQYKYKHVEGHTDYPCFCF